MVNIRPLNPELQKKANEELNEEPKRIQKDLEALREWIKKSPHITSRDDDQFLVNFLRGCKYSMERVKQKFDLYHTLKTHIPELTRNRDPLDEKLLGTIRQGSCLPLPNTGDGNGPSYFLFRPGSFDPQKYSIIDTMKVGGMITDLMMYEDDNFVVAGQIGICDFTGVTMSHFLHMNPTFMKKMTMMQQDAMPLRQKGSHFVNMPSFFLALFNIFLSFANEKTKTRLYIHGSDMEALYKVVPRKILPKEYGGDAGTFQEITDQLEERLVKNRNFFLEEEKYGVDEKKRVGRPHNSESLFGIEGSFRQLAID